MQLKFQYLNSYQKIFFKCQISILLIRITRYESQFLTDKESTHHLAFDKLKANLDLCGIP